MRPELKVNITAPTGPDLLPILFTKRNTSITRSEAISPDTSHRNE
jgi:hypothetical protein